MLRYFRFNWLPLLRRPDEPLVRFFSHSPDRLPLRSLVFGSSIGLFLLFGSFSVPALYLLLSLVIALYLSMMTAYRVERARRDHVLALLYITPVSRRRLLASLWSGCVWRVWSGQTMWMYWSFHAIIIIAGMVYLLLSAELGTSDALWLIVLGTILVRFQPVSALFCGGMVGLWCGLALPDSLLSVAAAGLSALCGWLLWLAIALLVALNFTHLALWQWTSLLLLPLLLSTLTGYLAFRLAEHRTQL